MRISGLLKQNKIWTANFSSFFSAKLIRLPTAFLHESGRGGGVIQVYFSHNVIWAETLEP